MRHIAITLGLFAVSGLAAFVASAPQSAQAVNGNQVAGSICVPANSSKAWVTSAGADMGNNAATSEHYYCPFTDGAIWRHDSVSNLYMDVYQNSTSALSVTAVVEDRSSSTISYGTTATTMTTGAHAMGPGKGDSTHGWLDTTMGGGYAFFDVVLPGNGSGVSRIQGYWATN